MRAGVAIFLFGQLMIACAAGHGVVPVATHSQAHRRGSPQSPTVAGRIQKVVCETVPGTVEVVLLDWVNGQTSALVSSVKHGHVIVAYTSCGLRVLPDCKLGTDLKTNKLESRSTFQRVPTGGLLTNVQVTSSLLAGPSTELATIPLEETTLMPTSWSPLGSSDDEACIGGTHAITQMKVQALADPVAESQATSVDGTDCPFDYERSPSLDYSAPVIQPDPDQFVACPHETCPRRCGRIVSFQLTPVGELPPCPSHLELSEGQCITPGLCPAGQRYVEDRGCEHILTPAEQCGRRRAEFEQHAESLRPGSPEYSTLGDQLRWLADEFDGKIPATRTEDEASNKEASGRADAATELPACEAKDVLYFEAGENYAKGRRIAAAIHTFGIIVQPNGAMSEGPLAARALRRTGELWESMGIFDKAADGYAAYARMTPPPPAAAELSAKAIEFRLGLSACEDACRAVTEFSDRFAANWQDKVIDLILDVGSQCLHQGSGEEVLKLSRQGLALKRLTRSQEFRLLVQAAQTEELLGKAAARKRYAAALGLVPKLATAEAGSADPALQDAVGFILFREAEFERKKLTAVPPLPPFAGLANTHAVRNYLNQIGAPWLMRRVHTAQAVVQKYEAVRSVRPEAAPRWIAAASSRIGEIWDQLVEDVYALPISDEILKDEELREVYRQAVLNATSGLRSDAWQAFKRCADYSLLSMYADTSTEYCLTWLERDESRRRLDALTGSEHESREAEFHSLDTSSLSLYGDRSAWRRSPPVPLGGLPSTPP
jgi:hypothetical protein